MGCSLLKPPSAAPDRGEAAPPPPHPRTKGCCRALGSVPVSSAQTPLLDPVPQPWKVPELGCPTQPQPRAGPRLPVPRWEALCSGCLSPGPTGRAAGTLPGGHDQAQKQGVTMVHVGTDKRRESRGPWPRPARQLPGTRVREDPDMGQPAVVSGGSGTFLPTRASVSPDDDAQLRGVSGMT